MDLMQQGKTNVKHVYYVVAGHSFYHCASPVLGLQENGRNKRNVSGNILGKKYNKVGKIEPKNIVNC